MMCSPFFSAGEAPRKSKQPMADKKSPQFNGSERYDFLSEATPAIRTDRFRNQSYMVFWRVVMSFTNSRVWYTSYLVNSEWPLINPILGQSLI